MGEALTYANRVTLGYCEVIVEVVQRAYTVQGDLLVAMHVRTIANDSLRGSTISSGFVIQ